MSIETPLSVEWFPTPELQEQARDVEALTNVLSNVNGLLDLTSHESLNENTLTLCMEDICERNSVPLLNLNGSESVSSESLRKTASKIRDALLEAIRRLYRGLIDFLKGTERKNVNLKKELEAFIQAAKEVDGNKTPKEIFVTLDKHAKYLKYSNGKPAVYDDFKRKFSAIVSHKEDAWKELDAALSLAIESISKKPEVPSLNPLELIRTALVSIYDEAKGANIPNVDWVGAKGFSYRFVAEMPGRKELIVTEPTSDYGDDIFLVGGKLDRIKLGLRDKPFRLVSLPPASDKEVEILALPDAVKLATEMLKDLNYYTDVSSRTLRDEKKWLTLVKKVNGLDREEMEVNNKEIVEVINPTIKWMLTNREAVNINLSAMASKVMEANLALCKATLEQYKK